MEIFFSTLLVIFVYIIKQSFTEAKEQKLIAIRIHSYLMFTVNEILNTKSKELVTLIDAGGDLHNKEQEFLTKGEIESFKLVMEEFEKEMKEVKKNILTDKTTNNTMNTFFTDVQALISEHYDFKINNLYESKQNIVNNNGFISDEEASKISWVMALRIITIKGYLINLIMNTQEYFIITRYSKEFSTNDVIEPTSKILVYTILLGKELFPALKEADKIKSKSVIELCIKNIFRYFKT